METTTNASQDVDTVSHLLMVTDQPVVSVVKLTIADYIVEVFLLVFTIVIGGLGNGMVLVYNIFKRSKDSMTALDISILSSTIASFIICVFYLPVQVYSTLYGKWPLGTLLCSGQLMLGMLCTAVPQGVNLLIAAYCYLKCVVNPHLNISLTVITIINILIWVADILLLNTPVILGFIKVRFDTSQMLMCWGADDPKFGQFVLMSIIPTMHAPTLVAMGLYILLPCQLRRAGSRSGRNVKTAKSMAGLFVLFMVCLMPNLLLRFIEKAVSPPGHVRRYSQYILYLYFPLSIFYYINRIPSIIPPRLLKLLHQPNAVSKTISQDTESSAVGSNSKTGQEEI